MQSQPSGNGLTGKLERVFISFDPSPVRLKKTMDRYATISLGQLMEQFSLGLLHFNTFWDLNPRSGQRHCTEALSPLLNCLLEQERWRVSIEICGSSLEYLSAHHPELIESLKILLDRGQIELISALYTPSIWVAYPRRDLIKSVEANRRALDRLQLPQSRCFFAQEAFFGYGLQTMNNYFDTVICKDELLTSQLIDLSPERLYRLGDLKVVVASDHIVNGLARSRRRHDERMSNSCLASPQISQLELRAQQLGEADHSHRYTGCVGEVRWCWYHCGDGNYFGTLNKPDQLDECYRDASWKAACLTEIHELHEQGWKLSRIDELTDRLDYTEAAQLPFFTEGFWNPSHSDGVFCWMGRNSTVWEDDLTVLKTTSQARQRIVLAEEMLNSTPSGMLLDEQQELLVKGWESLLHAQISDALGWTSGPKLCRLL